MTTGTSERPNLLFILTDQQRADTLGCYGNPLVQTPNLDGLASSGSVFENAYVTQPVCTPARASLMTGLYPHTHGCIDNNLPLPEDARTLAELVSLDHRRAYMGKWHLGDEMSPQHGFDEWVTIEDYYRAYSSGGLDADLRSDYHHFLVDNGVTPAAGDSQTFTREQAARLPEELTKARFLGRRASRFVQEADARPFILYVSFLEPHRPYFGPLDDLYAPSELPLGPHFREPPPENAAGINRVLAEHYLRGGEIDGSDLTTDGGSRQLRARYLGNVTLVDRAVGDILAALERSGRAGNTIVVYTSEHGDMMGDHGIFEKCVMYEEAIRIPLIIRVPGLPGSPRRIGGRVSQIDLVPTLLDLLGQPDAGLAGTSRRDVLAGEATLAGNDVVVEWNGSEWRPARPFRRGLPPEAFAAVRGPWRTLVSADGWKLNLSTQDQCELYDLNSDPHERLNLFDDPAQSARIADLTARLRAWQEPTGDDLPLPT